MSESVGERGESDTPGMESEGERGRKEGEQMRVKERVGIAWESEGEVGEEGSNHPAGSYNFSTRSAQLGMKGR